MKKKPWYKHDANDWLADIELRLCSLAARGLLEDLMCMAHNSEPYGYIMIGTKPGQEGFNKALSTRVRAHHKQVQQAWKDLLRHGRIKIDEEGNAYIKRMVEDSSYTLQQKYLGGLGGNPKLATTHKAPLKAPLKPEIESEIEIDKEKEKKSPIESRFAAPALSLSRRLMASIASWKPDYREIQPSKANRTAQSWANDIEKALRLDKRDEDRLREIIIWLPMHEGNGGFRWRNQILSGKKLREQFDKLDIAMREQEGGRLKCRY